MAEKFRALAREHIFVFSAVFAAFVLATQLFLTKVLLLGGERPEELLYGVADIAVMLVPVALVCVTAILLGMKSTLTPRKNGLGKGLLLGLPFILLGVYAGFSTIADVGFAELSNPGLFKIITFVISMGLIGILEEFLCRGVLLSLMLEKWGHTRKGLLKSVFISSVIFGLTHLVTLFVYPHLILSVASQVFYSALVGVYLACVYIRCKNLYSVVILHAFFDACVLLINLLHLPAMMEVINPTEITPADGLGTIILWLPFFLIGLFLIRKKKLSA